MEVIEAGRFESLQAPQWFSVLSIVAPVVRADSPPPKECADESVPSSQRTRQFPRCRLTLLPACLVMASRQLRQAMYDMLSLLNRTDSSMKDLES